MIYGELVSFFRRIIYTLEIIVITVLFLASHIQVSQAHSLADEKPPLPSVQLPAPPPEAGKQGKVLLLSQIGGAVIDVALDEQRTYLGKGQRLLSLSLTEDDQFELLGSSMNLPDIIQVVVIV